jgi:glutamate mutase epsilon subunit
VPEEQKTAVDTSAAVKYSEEVTPQKQFCKEVERNEQEQRMNETEVSCDKQARSNHVKHRK